MVFDPTKYKPQGNSKVLEEEIERYCRVTIEQKCSDDGLLTHLIFADAGSIHDGARRETVPRETWKIFERFPSWNWLDL